MKKHKTLGNALSMLTASALLLSLCVIPSAAADSAAAPAAVFGNTSGDGGSNGISLSAERTFQASIPVDMTEAEAKEQGIPAVSGKCTLFSNARTIIEDPGRCFMKLVARSDTREIIGAQLMCQHASDMISQLSTAMVNHLTARQLLSVMRPHPSFEEALSEAVENLTAKLA